MPRTTNTRAQTKKVEAKATTRKAAAAKPAVRTARMIAREIKPRRIHNGKVGAPRVDIKKSDLRAFLKEGMTLREIAQIYQCHPSTISKRKKEFGITVPPRRKAKKA